MSKTLEAIRPIELAEVQEARKRIAGTIVRTPLIRLELGPDYPDIRLKLENLQPINAYKLRGATNAVAMLSESDHKRGVWTISAGNAGQGVAYAARQAGVPCTVVVIETAPKSKLERMRALGAKLIPVSYDVAWKTLEERLMSLRLREINVPQALSRRRRTARGSVLRRARASVRASMPARFRSPRRCTARPLFSPRRRRLVLHFLR